MMKTISNYLISTLFVGFISLFGFITFLMPDKEISEVENRSLVQFPTFTLEAVLDGEFERLFENYISDQFYLRDGWIKNYLKWQILTGQTFIYDYYIEDQWVYPTPFTTIDEEAIRFAAKNMVALNNYAKNHGIELFFFSLPDRRHMLNAHYPKWVEPSVGEADKEMFFSLLPDNPVNVIDVGADWRKRYDEADYRNFYFKTDHHWNMEGAFAGYEVIHRTLYENSSFFETAFDRKNYVKECITEKKFKGVYNQQLYMMIPSTDEPLCYYKSKASDVADWKVYVNGMGEENIVPFSDLYGRAQHMDKEWVTYADLYTSDYSEIHIINPNKVDEGMKEGARALILKDSYANPLLPLMAEHFYQTTYYDVRHNQGENLYEFIERYKYDIIIFLYSNGRTLKYLYSFGGLSPTALK